MIPVPPAPRIADDAPAQNFQAVNRSGATMKSKRAGMRRVVTSHFNQMMGRGWAGDNSEKFFNFQTDCLDAEKLCA
jgi:hypothetical protein